MTTCCFPVSNNFYSRYRYVNSFDILSEFGVVHRFIKLSWGRQCRSISPQFYLDVLFCHIVDVTSKALLVYYVTQATQNEHSYYHFKFHWFHYTYCNSYFKIRQTQPSSHPPLNSWNMVSSIPPIMSLEAYSQRSCVSCFSVLYTYFHCPNMPIQYNSKFKAGTSTVATVNTPPTFWYAQEWVSKVKINFK